MKTKPEICPAEKRVIFSVQGWQLVLGPECVKRVLRMGITKFFDYMGLGDLVLWIQGYKILLLGLQSLQVGHVIAYRYRGIRFGFFVTYIIPAGPGPFAGGHDACIRMQDCFIY